MNPLKQGLIGSRVKPEPSLKQCPSLGIITCSCIITVAMITDMRSPDVIFGKGWEIFLLLIMQLTLEREMSNRNTGGEKPPRITAEFQPSPWKYNQSQSPAPRKGTRMSQRHPAQLPHPRVMVRLPFSAPFQTGLVEKRSSDWFLELSQSSRPSRKRQEKQGFRDEL